MTFQEFINKWLGKKADFDGHYDGQCVDLFRFYVQDVLNNPQPKGVNGAADFWTNYDSDPNLKNFYDKIANTPTGVPQNGDVMLWNKKAGGGFGHVSVFIEGDVNNFVSFDQNWPTLSVCTKTKHNYTNVYGWLRPKVVSTTTPEPGVITTNTPKIDLGSFGVMERQAIISTLTDKDKEINRLETDNQSLSVALQEAEKKIVVYQEAVPCPDPIAVTTVPPVPDNLMTDLFTRIGAWWKRVTGSR